MLRLAMKAIPLRHDAEPLEILFEDDHLLALNKPPGVLTAPKHRYMVSLNTLSVRERACACVGPGLHTAA
jgi:23S rRNA-/tRNA-specific pseudouridylate synthase